MSQFLNGPHAICSCCSLPVPFTTCGTESKPKIPAVLTKNLIHRLLFEASLGIYQKSRPYSYRRRTMSGKTVFRCKSCARLSSALYWFDASNGYTGGLCDRCTERWMLLQCGHEEDGAVEKVRVLSLSATKGALALIAKYHTARATFVARQEQEALVSTSQVSAEIETELQLF